MEKQQEINHENDFGIDQNVKARIINSLNNDLNSQVKKLFCELHPADQADFISSLDFEKRAKLIAIIASEIDPETLAYLEDDLKNEVIELLGSKDSAKAIDQLEIDDAVQVIATIEEDDREEILDHVSLEKRNEIEEALSYSENSVGRLMRQDFVAVQKNWSIAKATHHLQNTPDLPDDFNYLVIVDDNFHPISEVMVSKVLKNKKDVLMSDIMSNEDIIVLFADMDKEEAAQVFSK